MVGITLSGGFCSGKPTLTIDPPTIPATATVTRDQTTKNFIVTINERGAGYATKPFIAVVGTGCTITPRIKTVTMQSDKIQTIELE